MNIRPDLLALAVSLGISSFHLAMAAAAPGTPAGNSSIANVRVSVSPGKNIPSTFMGLSHEWGNSQHFMGDSSTGANLIYRQFVTNLTAFGSGPIILRIGGNSTDTRGEPTPTTLQPYAEVARSTKVKFILGVNLAAGNMNLAVDQTKAYLSQMPPGSIIGLEIGNEPDLYVKHSVRQNAYDGRAYMEEFEKYKNTITPMLPAGVKLVGPSWTTVPFRAPWAWTDMAGNNQSFLAREAGSLAFYTQHYYVTNPGTNPTPETLLTEKAATDGPLAAAPAVALAHARGVPFRMDEFSSVSNVGVHGVSDGFASALWAIDTMFEYVNVGVDGLNWEASDGNVDGPFYFNVTRANRVSSYQVTAVNPLYYAMLFFQEATGSRSQLLHADVSTRANVKAWATIDSTGTARLAIINKDERATGAVSVSIPGYSHASVVRLTAPSIGSTTDVTLAGQNFDGTANGMPRGKRQAETISGSNGLFEIPINATSAALVTFSR